MQRYILLLLLSMALVGCCGFRSTFCQYPYKAYFKKPTEEQADLINRAALVDIIYGWGAQLRYDRGILLCSSCAVFDTKIKKIRMEFNSQDLLELIEARKLLVYIVEGLLRRVNNYIGIEGVMSIRPFSFEQIEIVINFESFHGLFVDNQYNGRTTLLAGIASYADFSAYNSQVPIFGCKKEPYLLSKQLVEIEERVKTPYIREAHRPELNHIKERYAPREVFRQYFLPRR